jgi:hypothetical protein
MSINIKPAKMEGYYYITYTCFDPRLSSSRALVSGHHAVVLVDPTDVVAVTQAGKEGGLITLHLISGTSVEMVIGDRIAAHMHKIETWLAG